MFACLQHIKIIAVASTLSRASIAILFTFSTLISPLTQAQTAKPMSVLLGSKGEGTTTDTITDTTGSYINANRFQAQASGNTKRINAKINAIQGKYQVALYTDRNGQPNRLIATSSEVSPKTNGWHNFPLATQASLTKGRSYWIAIWSNDTNARVYASNNGVLRWNNIPYSPKWPTSLSLPTAGNYTYSMYAESSGGAAAIAPIVKLTAPLDDASYTAGSNINIAATATDSDGNIAKVEFFASSGINTTTNTKLGEKTQAPWTMMWTNVAAGNYAITAKATDSQGLMSTSEPADIIVNVAPPPPTNQAPNISLTTPTNNSSVNVNTAINIAANATDADGTINKVEFYASLNGTNTKLGEDSATPYTFAWTPTIAGTYAVTARATDDKGAMATSIPISVIVNVVVIPPPPPPPPPTSASDFPANDAEAGRFFAQSAFGATQTDFTRLRQIGYTAWLNEQLNMPMQYSHLISVKTVAAARNDIHWSNRPGMWDVNDSMWIGMVDSNDQLRQRTMWALSQIFVVSLKDGAVYYLGNGMASYVDMLYDKGFGNFRDLLESVTKSTAMGSYLSHIYNEKEDPTIGSVPDQNYAREVMQLFTIGLWELNIDGTRKLDAIGNPIPTYSNADVVGASRVLTGFTFDRATTQNWDNFYGFWAYPDNASQERPMKAFPAYHSISEKKFLGVTIPVSTTPDPEGDLKKLLDSLYNHPNVGPFIGKQLIQRLVTSNPSPAYVTRVATVFNNNGSGVRGDMKAVIRAILLDTEARSASFVTEPTFGKVREPVLRMAQLMRALKATRPADPDTYGIGQWLYDKRKALWQTPLGSATVFNFYRPDFRPSNSALSQAGLVAPEMQLINQSSVDDIQWFLRDVFENAGIAGCCSVADRNTFYLKLDYSELMPLVVTPDALIDRLNTLFMAGQMSPELRASIKAEMSYVTQGGSQTSGIQRGVTQMKLAKALYVLLLSAEYVVQK
jgi:uncharacterized protein (DUF1800 family)